MAKKRTKKQPADMVVTSETGVTLITQEFLPASPPKQEVAGNVVVTQRAIDKPLEPLPRGQVAGDGYGTELWEKLQAVAAGRLPFSALSSRDLEYATGPYYIRSLLPGVLLGRAKLTALAMLSYAYPDGRTPDASWRVATCCMLVDQQCEEPYPDAVRELWRGRREACFAALEHEFPETRPTTPLAYYAFMCASDHENAVVRACGNTYDAPAQGRKAKLEARERQVKLLAQALAG